MVEQFSVTFSVLPINLSTVPLFDPGETIFQSHSLRGLSHVQGIGLIEGVQDVPEVALPQADIDPIIVSIT